MRSGATVDRPNGDGKVIADVDLLSAGNFNADSSVLIAEGIDFVRTPAFLRGLLF